MEYKTYTFDVCELSPKKICSGKCGGCGKDGKIEIQGLDILERAKQYQAEKGCNYETALIAVSKKGDE
jgi:translation initiation factor 1 (eIF-1/SUI1)